MTTNRSFPRRAMQVHRTEQTNAELRVIEGALPAGLGGHLFIVGPVGNYGDAGQMEGRTTLINGDGMVYRIDLDGGRPRLTSRIVEPACSTADAATQPGSAWEDLGFRNFGLMRASKALGSRDFGNTAFVPMYEARTGAARMLVTYDAGRPVEIDPVSLETLTPVGYNTEWQSAMPGDKGAFKFLLSSAHPVWDARTGELFTANYRLTLRDMMLYAAIRAWIPGKMAAAAIGQVSAMAGTLLSPLLSYTEGKPRLLSSVATATTETERQAARLAAKLGLIPDSNARLVRWDGHGRLDHWTVMLPDGRPVEIQNSMHQLAVTRDFIVLLDTNFKITVNQWYNTIGKDDPTIDRLIRLFFAKRQLSQTLIYVIRRSDLEKGDAAPGNGERLVTAKPVKLPYGSVHFLADYDDAGDRITVHMAHGSALDIAEWVRSWDVSQWSGKSPGWLSGMVTGAADMSRLGRYVIDGEQGRVVQGNLMVDESALWAAALYTGNGVPAWGELPERIEQLYWFSNGFWPETLTDFVVNLYARYPDRIATLERLRAMGSGDGLPLPCLFRLDTRSMRIEDRYDFPPGHLLSSPQFVPNGAGPEGWVLTTVVTDERCAIWVFDAGALRAGPIAKLAGEALQFGFTLHTAWLPKIAPSTAGYRVDPRVDFGPAIAGNERLEAFFREIIYPATPSRAEVNGAARAAAPSEVAEGVR